MTLAAASQTVSGYLDSTGKAHPGSLMQIGTNGGKHPYWANSYPFINLLKHGNLQSSPTADPGTVDANGYIDATNSGNSKYTVVSGGNYMKAGTWVLKWTGGTCSLTNAGTLDTDTATRKTYINVPAAAVGNVFVTMSGKVTDCVLVHEDDEADYDLGFILSPQYRSDHAGVQWLRTIDWQGQNQFQVDWADFKPYGWVTWYQTDAADVFTDVPIQALCEMCNEMNADLWVHVPHMATNSTVSSLFGEIDTHLDVGRSIYWELANEVWNNTYQSTKWFLYGDATTRTPTMDPNTAIVTEATHGMATGEPLRGYSNPTHNKFPFGGGALWPINTGTNTWRCCSTDPETITDISNATTAVVTIAGHPYSNGDTVRIYNVTMTGFTDDSDYTVANAATDTFELSGVNSSGFGTFSGTALALADCLTVGTAPTEYVTNLTTKVISESSKTMDVNWSERWLAMIPFAEAATTLNVVNLLSARSGVDTQVVNRLAVAGVREAYDYVCIAPYAKFTDLAGFENETFAALTDYMIDTDLAVKVDTEIEDHIAALGTYRLITYEGGDHNGKSGRTTAQDTKVVGWARDTEATRFYLYYLKWLATQGITHFTNYHAVGGYSGSGTWGLMEQPGDTDATEYLGVKPYIDAGGAPPF